MSDRYAARIEEKLTEETRIKLKLPKGATYGDAIALAQVLNAIKGKTEAARELREAVEGRSPQRVEMAGPDRREVAIRVEYARERLREKLGLGSDDTGPGQG